MALESPGEDPIILDLGTGLRFFGLDQPADGTFRGSAFVTHLHWDHVQGLPFFAPINQPGAELDIYAPVEGGGSLEDAFEEFMRPPYFPVRASDLKGHIRFHALSDGDVSVGAAKVRVRPVPHVGATNGYRVESGGVKVAYISDHQAPLDRSMSVAESVLELCDGVDLLVHDAQYTPEEWEEKDYWGHCSVDYAVHVARESGARRLALFHHDPSHGDDFVDRLLESARCRAWGCGIEEVIAAAEGTVLDLHPV